jgi:hypothetical protein
MRGFIKGVSVKHSFIENVNVADTKCTINKVDHKEEKSK